MLLGIHHITSLGLNYNRHISQQIVDMSKSVDRIHKRDDDQSGLDIATRKEVVIVRLL
jgi:hypothetical protein